MFYSSIIKMAIKEEDDGYVCTLDYKNAETSYKSVISFAMGMLAARIVALKKYNIIHMFHLKDKSIDYSPKGKNIPDWFGVDSTGKAFLFESKGTDEASVNKKRIGDAAKQLKSIRSVIDKSGCIPKCYGINMEKHVIVSCFRCDRKNKIDNRWYIQDIDPEGEGNIDIRIDINREIYKYYETFVSFLDSYASQYEEREIEQQKYYFLCNENEKFGIHRPIYDMVKFQKYTENNGYIYFYENINDILTQIKCDKYIKDSSAFNDGIIFCSIEKFNKNM